MSTTEPTNEMMPAASGDETAAHAPSGLPEVAAVGLMAGVAWELGRAAVVDWFTALLALVTALLLIRFRINSVWLVIGGGAAGILYHLLT